MALICNHALIIFKPPSRAACETVYSKFRISYNDQCILFPPRPTSLVTVGLLHATRFFNSCQDALIVLFLLRIVSELYRDIKKEYQETNCCCRRVYCSPCCCGSECGSEAVSIGERGTVINSHVHMLHRVSHQLLFVVKIQRSLHLTCSLNGSLSPSGETIIGSLEPYLKIHFSILPERMFEIERTILWDRNWRVLVLENRVVVRWGCFSS